MVGTSGERAAPVRGAGHLLEVVEYRVAPDEDLGGWFESDGEMTVYVIDGEIEVTLENEGSWRLGAGEAISHPADIRHRWVVVGDRAAWILLSVAHAHPAAGPVPLPAPDDQAAHSTHDAADHHIMCVIL